MGGNKEENLERRVRSGLRGEKWKRERVGDGMGRGRNPIVNFNKY